LGLESTERTAEAGEKLGSAEVGASQPSSAALNTMGVYMCINAKQQKPQRNANYAYLCIAIP
jgi:hypothetical protein